jgi:hypothetical protein
LKKGNNEHRIDYAIYKEKSTKCDGTYKAVLTNFGSMVNELFDTGNNITGDGNEISRHIHLHRFNNSKILKHGTQEIHIKQGTKN